MKYHFTNPHFRTCKSLSFRNQFLCKKSNKKNRPFLLRFQTLTHSKKGGDFCPSAMNLHPRICMCPFAWEKTTASLIRELNLYLENQKKKKQNFNRTVLLYKTQIRETEKLCFKKTDILLNQHLFIFIAQDKKKMQKLFKFFGVKLLRLLKNFQNQHYHLFYIDCLLVFEFLFLPRYNLEAWNSLMLKRSELRLKHHNCWQIFFYLVKKTFYWQVFPMLHKKFFAPFLLQPSYYFFAYSSLIPNYGAQLCTFVLSISIISYSVTFLDAIFKTFFFRWVFISFCLYVAARFFYFYTNPYYQKKGGLKNGN